MRQTMRLLLGILLLTSVSAFADSFSGLKVTLTINPNYGVGENTGGYITGPGVNLLVGGGTPSFFNGPYLYLPGAGWGGSSTIYWDGAIGDLGSQQYSNFGNFSLPYLQLDSSFLNAGGFTFPTNPQDWSTFTITVPASLGIVTGAIVSDCNTCQTFILSTLPGQETLSFQYYPDWGYYFAGGSFTSLTTTPEPGTLGLLATGIGALAWLRVKREAA